MKRLRRIVRFLVTTLLVSYLGLLVLLHFDPLQAKLTDWVATHLGKQLKTEVKIASVEVGLFNRVVLHGVVIKDQQQKDLLQAQSIAAKIQLSPLLKGIVSLRTISLLDADILLYQLSKAARPNYQFLLDVFKSKDTAKESSLHLRINSFILRRCRLRYDQWFVPATPNQFNPAHLHLSSFDANVSLKTLQKDSINLRVRSLSFQEKSGAGVKGLRFKLAANSTHAVVENFVLQLSESVVRQDEIRLQYDRRKGLLETLKMAGKVQSASLSTKDIAPFLPAFRGWGQTFVLNTDYQYQKRRLTLTNFSLSDTEGKVRLSTHLTAEFVPKQKPSVAVSKFLLALPTQFAEKNYYHFTQKHLPKELLALQEITLSGSGQYDVTKGAILQADLTTRLGAAKIHGTLRKQSLTAKIIAKDWNVAAITQNRTLPQKAAFVLTLQDFSTDKKQLSGRATLHILEADYRGYRYQNINARLQVKKYQWALGLQAVDPQLQLAAQAKATWKNERFSDITLTAHVDKISPSALNLTDFWGNAIFSLVVKSRLASLSEQIPTGELQLSQLKMKNGAQSYHLDQFRLLLTAVGEKQSVQLFSDFAQGKMEGKLSLPHLQKAFYTLMESVFPHLLSPPKQLLSASLKEEWRFQLSVQKDDFFQKFLKLPLSLQEKAELAGHWRTDSGDLSLIAHGKGITYDGNTFRNPRLYLHGADSQYELLVQALAQFKHTDLQVVLRAQADSGKVATHLSWDDVEAHHYTGELKALLQSVPSVVGKHRLSMALQPTQLLIRDSLWTIEGGTFDWREKSLKVDNFKVGSGEHSLQIHGSISPHDNDSIEAVLHKMDVDYILSLIDFTTLRFQGLATGKALLTLSEGVPDVTATLEIDSLYMNKGLLGHTLLKGGFDGRSKRILLNAEIQEGQVGAATVKGFVSPAHKNLDLRIENEALRADFLQPYLSDFLTQLKARATGTFRVAGTFKDIQLSGSQDFVGDAYVNALGVSYHVEQGHVEAMPTRFEFTEVRVSDQQGGSGELSGVLTHDYLRDMAYTFDATVDNLYVYHQPSVPSLPYFAQVYGSGNVTLTGQPGSFSADIYLRPERRSSLTYKIEAQEESNVPFLTFRDRDSVIQQQTLSADSLLQAALYSALAQHTAPSSSNSSDIRLNFYIDANPNAELRVMMDQKGADYVSLRGEGALHATYYNKGAFQVYGTYNVLDGVYRMTMQDVLSKEFAFTGGTVTFTGEPFQAALDLKAIYTIPSASLAGLYTGAAISENNVKVNCLLNIAGRAESPQVDFDLDLPTADNEVKQLVRSVINTQNDMNMQILYLLSFGRFYSYNQPSAVATANESQSIMAMKSFLSSTLTSQLNEILSNAMGTSDWSFGTNISTGDIGWSDIEVEGILRGSLFNNRLQLNGNLGYRDRALSARTSNFIGDFDIRYLLTPKGGVSLKGYSTTNERYFTRSSLITQGLGIMFRKDFNRLGDLFRRKKKSLEKARQ